MDQTARKAAIYIRVSTDAQREEGYSIDAQKEALTAYCVSKGIKHYDYYIDGGFTGSNLDRPEMQRLIRDVEQDRISHVLVYKLDRLSRSQKDTLHLIEDVLNPHRSAFVSLNESMDTGTPMGRLMLGILSAFAQLERENIRERTRMGMKERVKAGYWMGGGKIPFGYDYDSEQGILVPNADAKTVERMYRLYLQGYSPGNIAEMTGLKYDRQVMQILKRKTNTGVIVYQGEEYSGRHKPIVSQEIYDRTMLEMEARSGKNLHAEVNLLTGLVFCGHCGAKMRYQKWGKKGHKLVCYSRQGSKAYLIRDENCPQEHVWADEIEEVVVEDLFRFSAKKQLDKSQDEAETVEMVLQGQIEKMEKRLRRLYRLYGEAEDEELRQEIEEQREELKGLREKAVLEAERKTLSRKRTRTLEAISSLADIWSEMKPLERRVLVDQVIERVTVTDRFVGIDYKI